MNSLLLAATCPAGQEARLLRIAGFELQNSDDVVLPNLSVDQCVDACIANQVRKRAGAMSHQLVRAAGPERRVGAVPVVRLHERRLHHHDRRSRARRQRAAAAVAKQRLLREDMRRRSAFRP